MSIASSSPRRFPLRPSFFTGVLVSGTIATFAFAANSLSVNTTSAVSSQETVLTTVGEKTPDIQLADEIIRRLRRIGLNFNRARIQRPYDPAGDLC